MEHWQETELEKLRREADEALGILMGRLGQRQGKPPLTLVEAARELAKRDETNSDIITSQSVAWKRAEVLEALVSRLQASGVEQDKGETLPDKLKEQLSDAMDKGLFDSALLSWAKEQYDAGRIYLHVEVREVTGEVASCE